MCIVQQQNEIAHYLQMKNEGSSTISRPLSLRKYHYWSFQWFLLKQYTLVRTLFLIDSYNSQIGTVYGMNEQKKDQKMINLNSQKTSNTRRCRRPFCY